MHFPVYHTSSLPSPQPPLQPSLYYPFIDSLSFFPTQHSIIYDTVMSHPHYRGIFMHLHFVEPPSSHFPLVCIFPCVPSFSPLPFPLLTLPPPLPPLSSFPFFSLYSRLF